MDYCDFDIKRATDDAQKINPELEVIEVSAKTGAGVERWVEYIKRHLN